MAEAIRQVSVARGTTCASTRSSCSAAPAASTPARSRASSACGACSCIRSRACCRRSGWDSPTSPGTAARRRPARRSRRALERALDKSFAELEARGRAALAREGSRRRGSRSCARLDLRYAGTETALACPLDGDGCAARRASTRARASASATRARSSRSRRRSRGSRCSGAPSRCRAAARRPRGRARRPAPAPAGARLLRRRVPRRVPSTSARRSRPARRSPGPRWSSRRRHNRARPRLRARARRGGAASSLDRLRRPSATRARAAARVDPVRLEVFTTSSCRSPSRWARCCAAPPSRPTSASGSTSRARSSTASGPRRERAAHPRAPRRDGRDGARVHRRAPRRWRPATCSSPTIRRPAARTCPTSPWSRRCTTRRASCASSWRAAATTPTSAASRPGSMPPFSRTLAEEGVVLRALRVVRAGALDEARVRRALAGARYPGAQPGRQRGRPRRRRSPRTAPARGSARDGRAARAAPRCAPTCATCRTTPRPGRRPRSRGCREGEHGFADALDDGTPIRVAPARARAPHGDRLRGHAARRSRAT